MLHLDHSAREKLILFVFIVGTCLVPTVVSAITTFSIPTSEAEPFAITAGSDSAMWFTERNKNKIGRITTTGVITEFTLPTPGGLPSAITAGPDGNIWFTAPGSNRIGRITPNGNIAEFPVPTANSGLRGIVAGWDGALWFTEKTANRIGRITPNGDTTEFLIPSPNSGPEGITVGPDGYIWFVERDGGRVGRISTEGVINELQPPAVPLLAPVAIVTGADGYLWLTERSRNTIWRLSRFGEFKEYAAPTSGSAPESIARGPDGAIWFSQFNANQIGRLRADFVFEEFAVGGSVTSVAPGLDGNLWFTLPSLNRIGRLTPGGSVQVFPLPNNSIGARDDMAANYLGVYFAEAGAVGRIDPQGVMVRAAAGPNHLTLGHDGVSVWYTVDGAEHAGVVQLYLDSDIDTYYPLPGLYRTLRSGGIASGPDGNVWFTDGQNALRRVIRITPEGTITEFDLPGSWRPGGIAAGSDDNLWIMRQCREINRFTTTGVVSTFQRSVCTPTDNLDMAAGPDGNLWFSDPGLNRIGKITTGGQITEYPLPGASSEPWRITAGPEEDGIPEPAVWFTERAAVQLGRMTVAGNLTEYPLPLPFKDPRGITSREPSGTTPPGSTGRIWFTDRGDSEEAGFIGAMGQLPKPCCTGHDGVSCDNERCVDCVEFAGGGGCSYSEWQNRCAAVARSECAAVCQCPTTMLGKPLIMIGSVSGASGSSVELEIRANVFGEEIGSIHSVSVSILGDHFPAGIRFVRLPNGEPLCTFNPLLVSDESLASAELYAGRLSLRFSGVGSIETFSGNVQLAKCTVEIAPTVMPGEYDIRHFSASGLFDGEGGQIASLNMDGRLLVQPPPPTPTTTPTVSPSRSSTPSQTPTRTPSLAATVSPSRSPSLSPLPSHSPTKTETPTSTSTSTSSHTPSPTPTVTPPSTPSASVTLSPTETEVPTVTAPPTATATQAPTATSTPSVSPSSTPTMPPVPTPSNTPTTPIEASATPTHSPMVALTVSPTSTRPVQVGDCSGDGIVTVDELVTLVDLKGNGQPRCPDGSNSGGFDRIRRALEALLKTASLTASRLHS